MMEEEAVQELKKLFMAQCEHATRLQAQVDDLQALLKRTTDTVLMQGKCIDELRAQIEDLEP